MDFIGAGNTDWLWELAAGIAEWSAFPAVTAMLTIRWMGLATFAPGYGTETVGPKVRLALAILLAGLMAPGVRPPELPPDNDFAPWALMVTGEFVMGAALGLSVSLWVSAARSAGEWVAMVAGFGTQSHFQPDWDGDSADPPSSMGRLFSILALAIFFTARGPLRLMDLVGASLRVAPAGGSLVFPGPAQADAIFSGVGEALALSFLAAWPILLAMLTTQIAVVLATNTQSVVLSLGILSPTRMAVALVIVAAGLGGFSAGFSGTLDHWFEHTLAGLDQLQAQSHNAAEISPARLLVAGPAVEAANRAVGAGP
ncbi:MAG: flagellar biosynthetic protein FliR [bacterium]